MQFVLSRAKESKVVPDLIFAGKLIRISFEEHVCLRYCSIYASGEQLGTLLLYV